MSDSVPKQNRGFWIMFAVIALGPPLTLPTSDIVLGFVGIRPYLAAWIGFPGMWVLGSALAAGIAFRYLTILIARGESMTPVRLLVGSLLAWSLAHVIIGNNALHWAAGYMNDPVGNALTTMTSGAVGLYFGILAVIVSVDAFEAQIIGDRERKPLTVRFKLFLSITLIVLAFLLGAAGVALYPIYQGTAIDKAIPAILRILVPYLFF